MVNLRDDAYKSLVYFASRPILKNVKKRKKPKYKIPKTPKVSGKGWGG